MPYEPPAHLQDDAQDDERGCLWCGDPVATKGDDFCSRLCGRSYREDAEDNGRDGGAYDTIAEREDA